MAYATKLPDDEFRRLLTNLVVILNDALTAKKRENARRVADERYGRMTRATKRPGSEG